MLTPFRTGLIERYGSARIERAEGDRAGFD
jgi:hypothetical protein